MEGLADGEGVLLTEGLMDADVVPEPDGLPDAVGLAVIEIEGVDEEEDVVVLLIVPLGL